MLIKYYLYSEARRSRSGRRTRADETRFTADRCSNACAYANTCRLVTVIIIIILRITIIIIIIIIMVVSITAVRRERFAAAGVTIGCRLNDND